MSLKKHKPNRLAGEKSPYLLQHAYNPVDWHPWSEEAFNKARDENKPVFLSIGYSTCHWCHVMERESFEDEAVASLMNEVFVAIKVDREERPDIDNIYMSICQMITGGGGWPLTIVMTHDKKPFFAGTYFPKEGRFGRIGFVDLVKQIDAAWKTRREEIENSADSITFHLRDFSVDKPGGEINPVSLEESYKYYKGRFDEEYGGFGTAPKFPSPQNLMFLLRYWKRTGEVLSLEMVEKTLKQMRMGGVFDQIGGGFHRYSTDKSWLLPHFEKMLYDQAMLTILLTETYQATGNKIYKIVAEEIIAYVLREMRSPEGGFYSAEDADSEGEEGKFYLWTASELKEILNEPAASEFIERFNISEEGNFEEESSGRRNGKNIPYLTSEDWEYLISPEFNEIRGILFRHREKRIHPFKDDKILTDWNGLMIAALAKAARISDNIDIVNAAEKAVEFVWSNLREETGRLLHRFRGGDSSIQANIDDYSFLVWGLIEMYETTFNPEYLFRSIDLTEILIEYFWDEIYGGFFFSPFDGEEILLRKKEIYDAAIPSGNSVALNNLIKLGRITADPKYENLAAGLMKAYSKTVEETPSAFSMLLCGVEFLHGGSHEIIIAGKYNDDKAEEMISALNKNFFPNKVVIRIEEKDKKKLGSVIPYINNFDIREGDTKAYVCKNYVCEIPVSDASGLLSKLKDGI